MKKQDLCVRVVKKKKKYKKSDNVNYGMYYNISDIAKVFGLSGIKLNKMLCEDKIMFYDGRSYVMYTEYHKMKYTKFINNLHGSGHLYWTERGKMFLYNYLKEKGFEKKKTLNVHQEFKDIKADK